MIHRSPSSQPSGDDVDRHGGADESDPMPDEVLSQTAAELSGDLGQSEEERAERLAADSRLVEIMAREGFEGERFDELYKKLSKLLIGYAWPILRRWTEDGRIFRECEKYRRPVSRSKAWSGWTFEDRQQIVTDTCLEAVDFFRDYGLRKGKWDARRGASLSTHFVGACVCCFAKVFNSWWKEQQVADSMRFVAQEKNDPEGDSVERIPDPRPDPAMVAVIREEAGQVMRQLPDPQTREVLWLRALGYTQVEAAGKAGITAKAAERRLSRYREKLRDASTDPADPGDGRTGSL